MQNHEAAYNVAVSQHAEAEAAYDSINKLVQRSPQSTELTLRWREALKAVNRAEGYMKLEEAFYIASSRLQAFLDAEQIERGATTPDGATIDDVNNSRTEDGQP